MKDVLERFLKDRPTANQKADNADHADGRDRLPHLEPDQRRSDSHEPNTQGFLPLEWVFVVVTIFVIMIVIMRIMPMGVFVQRGWRCRPDLRLVGQACPVALRLVGHGWLPCHFK